MRLLFVLCCAWLAVYGAALQVRTQQNLGADPAPLEPATSAAPTSAPSAAVSADAASQDLSPIDCKYYEWTSSVGVYGPSQCVDSVASMKAVACGKFGVKVYRRDVEVFPSEKGRKCQDTEAIRTEQCKGPECDGNCKFDYSPWSECSKSCGSGVQTRALRILNEAEAVGCPTLPLTRECNTFACPQGCVQHKAPECPDDPTDPSSPLPVDPRCWRLRGMTCDCYSRATILVRYTDCTSTAQEEKWIPCEPDASLCPSSPDLPWCEMTPWSSWSACSATCGHGSQVRTRMAKDAKAFCTMHPYEEWREAKSCEVPCKLDCHFAPWDESQWQCSKPCGAGLRTRRKKLVAPAQNGGECDCKAKNQKLIRNNDSGETYCIEQELCNPEPCPVDCEVGPWTEWSTCSKSCTSSDSPLPGTRTRTRSQLTAPQFSGKKCPALSEEEPCGETPCPQDCKLGVWKPWSLCSARCGADGQRSRERVAITLPQSGGNVCPIMAQVEACLLDPCPATCQYGDWSEWSNCSAACVDSNGKPGYQRRTRELKVAAKFGGDECGALEQIRMCNVETRCPIDCEMSEWSPWGECTLSCGGGRQSRFRHIANPPRYGGAACGATVQSRPCNDDPCSVDCQVDNFGSWSPCSSECGGGTQIRRRKVLVPPRGPNPQRCPSLAEERECNVGPCPQHCEVSDWSPWSSCSAECGPGVKTRVRVIVQQPMAGGRPCPLLVEQTLCEETVCNGACLMGPWTDWSKCSKTCVNGDEPAGTQSRTRMVSKSPGSSSACPDPLQQTRTCNNFPCPLDCAVSEWTDWSACSESCGGGFTSRKRSITQQPAYGGKSCPRLHEEKSCNEVACGKDCVVSDWSPWSACSEPCRRLDSQPGRQIRTRTVLQEQTKGGLPCPNLQQLRSCNQHFCPDNCVVSDWGPLSQCTSRCGYGTINHEREVLVPSRYGGRSCPALVEHYSCFDQPCTSECVMTPWSAWSPCTAKCNGGRRRRTRKILHEGQSGCPTLYEEQSCNEHACPVDCLMSEWGAWSACDRDGLKTRSRFVISRPTSSGKSCPICLLERDDCVPEPHPEECWLQPCGDDGQPLVINGEQITLKN